MQSTNPQPNLSFQLPPLPPVQEKYVHFFACCGCQSKIKITCKSPFIEVTFQGTTSIQSGPQVQVTFSHFSNQTYFINLSSSFQEYQQQQQSVPRYASVAEFFDIDDLWPELFDDNQTEVQPNYNFPPPNTTASTAATTTTTTVTGDQQQWQQMQQRTPSPVMVTHQRHHHHPPPVQQLPPQPPPQQPPPPSPQQPQPQQPQQQQAQPQQSVPQNESRRDWPQQNHHHHHHQQHMQYNNPPPNFPKLVPLTSRPGRGKNFSLMQWRRANQ
jgi:hypothetical protein